MPRMSTSPSRLRQIVERGDEKQRQRYTASLNAARAIRQSKGKLTQKAAAAQFGISRTTMFAYAGSILRKNKAGQFASRDNLPTLVQIPTTEGPKYKVLPGQKQLRLVGAYREAVRDFLKEGTGKAKSKLREFDISVGVGKDRARLITDPEELKKLYSIHGDDLLAPGSGQYGYPEKKVA